jgi:hypothetical protein
MSDPQHQPGTAAPDDEARRRLVLNERIKASANLSNSIANTMIAAGAIGPLAADFYGVTTPKSPYWIVFAICWVASGLAAHAITRKLLGGLRP